MNMVRYSILEILQDQTTYLPSQQEMLKLKCMACVLNAYQFMDSLM